MYGEKVIAEEALLFVTDPVSFEDALPALHAGHDDRHDRPVAW
jgi:hypothetical protein